MALRAPLPTPISTPTLGPNVVLCGSYRRDSARLRADFGELQQAGCLLLSPVDVEFTASKSGFVLAAHEADREPADVEKEHLQAIRAADFIWLHAPDGYVGASGAMELGFAHSLGIPTYGRELPSDGTLREFVIQSDSPASAAARFHEDPGTPAAGLQALQIYYERRARERGWDRETLQECLQLLTGEVEELGQELSSVGTVADTFTESTAPAALELADVQLYVIHMANMLGIDLGAAVTHKERINEGRFGSRRSGRAS